MSDSIATRVDALTADGYRTVKFLNYDDGDFSKIIRKVESHFDEFEFKLMENVTHLPFGTRLATWYFSSPFTKLPAGTLSPPKEMPWSSVSRRSLSYLK